ncbi:MAG: Amuc_1100 family pilus-like protein [Puniceicoccales bacterium]|jgi:hypothetical protein|nr:Amuc_1100 family pilus-like protein [Puniceicoccales bacterium]
MKKGKQRLRIFLIAGGIFVTAMLGLAYANGRNKVSKLRSVCRSFYEEALLFQQSYGNCSEATMAKREEALVLSRQHLRKVLGIRQREESQATERIPSRTEFYYELKEESKRLAALAGECAVVLMEGERFGFFDTIRHGRMDDKAIVLWRSELLEIGTLLPILFGASEGDLRFHFIERETVSLQEFVTSPNDFFDARQLATLRAMLGSETHLYRLQFQCGTATLRRFLNALEDRLLPVVPRHIQVTTPIKPPGADEFNRWLLVDPQPSQCTMLLEWVQLLPDIAAPREGR